MTALIILFSPFITTALTGWVKNWAPFAALSDVARTPAVRLLGALIALGYVVLGMYVTGSVTPDLLGNAINAFIFALLAWLGSLGIFHAFFQKK